MSSVVIGLSSLSSMTPLVLGLELIRSRTFLYSVRISFFPAASSASNANAFMYLRLSALALVLTRLFVWLYCCLVALLCCTRSCCLSCRLSSMSFHVSSDIHFLRTISGRLPMVSTAVSAILFLQSSASWWWSCLKCACESSSSDWVQEIRSVDIPALACPNISVGFDLDFNSGYK